MRDPNVGRKTQIKGQRQSHRRQRQKLILKEYHTMVHSGAYLSHYLLRPPPLESLLLLLSSSPSSAAVTTAKTSHLPLVTLLFSAHRNNNNNDNSSNSRRESVARRRHRHHHHTRSIRRPEVDSRKTELKLLSSSQDHRLCCWPRLAC